MQAAPQTGLGIRKGKGSWCARPSESHHDILRFARPAMPNPRLAKRINEFLPQVRVGIDFGEGAGGIAVVRGQKILHAETYVDFHGATLEQRRQLRRGRRTRHAKKMRLARLRSWVLRQKLPGGSRLPDPHVVMAEKRFQVQPGVFQIAGQNPLAAPSWVHLAKEGKVDAQGFVKALTLIFQKRGYKWDAIALEEMTDARWKDFLTTARIPNDELQASVTHQIELRKDDPSNPKRGKTKIPPDELLDLLRKARERGNLPPEPRVAEHRSVKETELREVIAGFGKAAGIPTQTVERWQRELCGGVTPQGRPTPGLLNKVLRPARFENRLKTGCAWCGKPTPRKSKVRYIAYAAAVCNLRAREGRRVRRLNDQELEFFWSWWRLGERAAAPSTDAPEVTGCSPQAQSAQRRAEKGPPKLAGIQSHLRRLGAQEKMARQIFDLLWNDEPQGRASLCKQHLEMAAKGMTMKEAGVEWQTIAVRRAPNPCGQQHDARVLHRLEQILFRPGKTGERAWRYGPVQFISMEVPKPQTEQARKGEQKERKVESFTERLNKETGGICIYCDPAHPRPAEDKDHIFPQSRGGPDVWDNLVPACKSCNTEKGDLTPFEWFGRRDAQRWAAFALRVEELARKGVPGPGLGEGAKERGAAPHICISERKRALLLSQEPDFPENPTALAHVGSRPRQFLVEIRRLFESRGVKPPRAECQLGEPVAQRIDGRTTSQLRKSWLRKEGDALHNFPAKDRWDLANHAQDAALVAACPPHTWRETIFRHRALRPNREGKWVEQPELAVPELAPDWAEYMASRAWPLVQVLGRYPVNWKRSFADQTLWRKPQAREESELSVSRPIESIKVRQIRRVQSLYYRPRLAELAKRLGLPENKTLPIEELQKEFPGLRHLKLSVPKGGKVFPVRPGDGPLRKMQAKPAGEGLILWDLPAERGRKAAPRVSLLRPKPLQKFGIPRVDPPLEPGARILGKLERHDMIWLDRSLGRPDGFYRAKEFSDSGIVALPENAVPDELARKMSLKRADTDTAPRAASREIKLGKKDLAAYFASLSGEDRDAPSVDEPFDAGEPSV